MRKNKRDRQKQLEETIKDSPFVTDEELAEIFQVSIQTIRLDRLELSIPELRERIKYVAQKQLDEVKALPMDEVIGEIVDLQLDDSAISILDIQEEHVFSRTGIARGHHLFAQANSLAVAVIDDELALTARSQLNFTRQVRVGERVIAKAKVILVKSDRTVVEVNSFVGQERVFRGRFTMYRSHLEGGNESDETSY
ncbi:acyl-coenzyme A thioesterase PaaI-like protein [Scopulibacillus darangshiensis]|uniref:Transcription factor FapR n=1 Tax=Scopulibacillus darangshiensis TaxID=442528 RepID=A0A4R2P316_9BACL|nr:transcription factor FapR [Scopulibacillus darangshiensis]TCP29143.1 acyl-coenzyme A thioesterase PaaI-like protein [Scopulibacillus darangshiensis]